MRNQRAVSLACAVTVLLSFWASTPLSSQAARRSRREVRTSKLQKHDRARLAEARAQNKPEVTVLIASVPGANSEVARAITAAGGKVRYRDDDVSYIRAKVPTNQIEKLAPLSEIETLNLDGYMNFYSSAQTGETPKQESQAATAKPHIDPPGRNTPAENPYLPTRDIGAPQFVAAHPTFDGRGVTIAVVEGSPDVLAPELQSAKALDGTPVEKIVDVLSAVDAEDDRVRIHDLPYGDLIHLVHMQDEVRATEGRFEYKGHTYRAPRGQLFRVGILDERRSVGSDLNCDGNPPDSSGLFTFLWDEQTNTVWVDTNQDADFSDEKALKEYTAHHDIGIFGVDKPDTPVRESKAFTVRPHPASKVIELIPLAGGHTTSVVSVALGKGFFDGRMNGVAPEAQLLVVDVAAHENHSWIEGAILAVKHPKVDVVSIASGQIMRLNDGNFTTSVIWDRLVEKFKKPIIVGAGNEGPGVNTVAELPDASGVIAVGGYVHRETLRSNFGAVAVDNDHLVWLSSRGPREDGAAKPDIITPAATIASHPGSSPSYTTPNGAYTLAQGYMSSLGTSFSTPMAAGGVALLISAAKQSHVPYDAERLRWAILSSARYLPNYGAHEQGNGLMQVGPAWEMLQSAPEPVEISSSAPVNTILAGHLKDPWRGPGIYEREGWRAGQSDHRRIRFTRTSGAPGTMTFALRWTGNDGTYQSSESISLPLKVPVELDVAIHPKSAGIHSAMLNLVGANDPSRIFYRVLNTVIAAEQFTPNNQYMVTRRGQVDYPKVASYFFNVPPSTAAFNYVVQVPRGSVRVRVADPSGVLYQLSHPFFPGRGANNYEQGTISQTIASPEPGVWEVNLDNGDLGSEARFEAQPPTTFTVTAAVFAAEGSLATGTPAKRDTSLAHRLTFVNRMAGYSGTIMAAPLASAFSDRVTLTAGEAPSIFEVQVPPGTKRLLANIAGPSGSEADIDLYVFDCTGEDCVRRDQSNSDGPTEEIVVSDPVPGLWKIVIDAVTLPNKSVAVNYLDLFTNQNLGEVKSADSASKCESGSRCNSDVTLNSATRPAAPRRSLVVAEVTSEEVQSIEYRFNVETREPEPPILRRVPIGRVLIDPEQFHKR